MAQYTPPLRDMQFVLHELLNAVPQLNEIPAHADLDADTINHVLEEGGKFAAEVLLPLALEGPYSYRVPDTLSLSAGDYVAVPLGPRQMIGVVWRLTSEAGTAKKLRDVLERFDMPPMPETHRRFVDWLASAGQRLWQWLPTNPIGPGDSPYQSVSAFAGSPLMVAAPLQISRS